MKYSASLAFLSAALSFPVEAEICRYSRLKHPQQCEEGQVFGAIEKNYGAKTVNQVTAQYCDHRYNVVILKVVNGKDEFVFNCLYKLNIKEKSNTATDKGRKVDM